MSGPVNIAVFVLDDDNDLLDIIGQALNKTGVKNYTLFNDEDLFLEALTDEIHVCVVDHRLTRRNGFDIVKEIKKRNPDSYIIIYTGLKDADVILDYWDMGADRFILKKVDASEIPNLTGALVVGIEKAKYRVDFINFLQQERTKRSA